MNRSDAGKLGWHKSQDTHRRLQEARVGAYTVVPKLCQRCSNALPYKKRHNRYCSRSCAVAQNNTGWDRHNKSASTPRYCKQCSAVLVARASYCSQSCNQLHKRALHFAEFDKRGYCGPSSTITKKYLAAKRGYACAICSISQWQSKPLVLVLDHIDGNAENWQINNLRLLCPNCDSQTPTFKGRNAGKGRFARRQRYQKGLSY